MNGNLNLVELLKREPQGTVFYSPAFGICVFMDIRRTAAGTDVIRCFAGADEEKVFLDFLPNGQYFRGGECMLFPSKEEHDWAAWAKRRNDLPQGTVVLMKDDPVGIL